MLWVGRGPIQMTFAPRFLQLHVSIVPVVDFVSSTYVIVGQRTNKEGATKGEIVAHCEIQFPNLAVIPCTVDQIPSFPRASPASAFVALSSPLSVGRRPQRTSRPSTSSSSSRVSSPRPLSDKSLDYKPQMSAVSRPHGRASLYRANNGECVQ